MIDVEKEAAKPCADGAAEPDTKGEVPEDRAEVLAMKISAEMADSTNAREPCPRP